MIKTPGAGEILREEFLEPLGITAYRLSKEINVSTTTILNKEKSTTAKKI
jgi:plasmid maintenance system antidote protein VapI